MAMSNERLSALFDGVIAIAITLLVLELKLPDAHGNGDHVQFIAGLEEQIPEFVAWLISFVMIARIWHEQHVVWINCSKCDRHSIILTFMLMASCSLIPFSSHLVGDYPEVPLAVLVFSITMAFSGLTVAILASYTIKSSHLHRQEGPATLQTRTQYLFTVYPSMAILAILLAYAHEPLIGISVWLLEPIAAFLFRQIKKA